MPNYKPAFRLPGQNHLSLNALVFATREEAGANAADLFMRWTQPTGYEVVETDAPVNYAYVEGRLVAVPVTA